METENLIIADNVNLQTGYIGNGDIEFLVEWKIGESNFSISDKENTVVIDIKHIDLMIESLTNIQKQLT